MKDVWRSIGYVTFVSDMLHHTVVIRQCSKIDRSYLQNIVGFALIQEGYVTTLDKQAAETIEL